MLDQRFQCCRVVELAHASARVVDEMRVAINFLRFCNEELHVLHRPDLGVVIQPLALLELLDGETAELWIADLAEKS